MNLIRDIFTSPELYPLKIDFEKRIVKFVRMSRESYRDSVFLDLRTRHLGTEIEIRLDDLLLVAASEPAPAKRVHHILHTSFCCSTLLARYFELLPSCFVLKEPRLLAQIAHTPSRLDFPWSEVFDLCLRLLTRTYEPGEMIVIKHNDWCNPLGKKLLEQNNRATITFLMTPLRHFLLAVLKSEERRDWVRTRIRRVVTYTAVSHSLMHIKIDDLIVAEAAAYLWLTNRSLCTQLISNGYHSRVLVLSGEQVAGSPAEALRAIAKTCELSLTEQQLKWMITHSSVSKYSKDISRPYDVTSRHNEMTELEHCWGAEADAGIDWAMSYAAADNIEDW